MNKKTLLNLGRAIAAKSTIIGFVLVLLAMAYCIYSVQAIYNSPRDDAYYEEKFKEINFTSFNQKTIDEVKQLRMRTDTPVSLPDGKINPFRE